MTRHSPFDHRPAASPSFPTTSVAPVLADIRAILRLSNLLPFRQVLGIKNMVNEMFGRFPEV